MIDEAACHTKEKPKHEVDICPTSILRKESLWSWLYVCGNVNVGVCFCLWSYTYLKSSMSMYRIRSINRLVQQTF
jgi:hypothetical protein